MAKMFILALMILLVAAFSSGDELVPRNESSIATSSNEKQLLESVGDLLNCLLQALGIDLGGLDLGGLDLGGLLGGLLGRENDLRAEPTPSACHELFKSLGWMTKCVPKDSSPPLDKTCLNIKLCVNVLAIVQLPDGAKTKGN